MKRLLCFLLLIVEPILGLPQATGKVLRRRFEYSDEDINKYYLVTDDDFQGIPLNDSRELDDVLTGTEAYLDGSGALVLLDTNTTMVQPPKTNMASIVFPLNICNQITTTDIQAYKTLATTMEQYFDSCSIRSVNFTQRVMHPVDIPCGIGGNGTCTDRDITRWARYAEDLATNERNVDLKVYPYRMFIIPRVSPCQWLGLADVGCFGGACRSWLKGGADGYNILAAFHEFGHNLGFRHSTGPDGSEYGDFTAAMGGCCEVRCHNVPQAWSIGWYEPIDKTLDNKTCSKSEFAIPTMLSNRKNFVKIGPIFLSYRTRSGYDSGLRSAGLVHVHSFNGSRSNTYAKSQLVSVMAKGASFQEPMGQWSANVTNTNDTHAVVLAYRGAYKGSCGNGVCEAFAGETCVTCPKDCMRGTTRWGPFCCGTGGQCRFHWRCTTRKVTCKTECT
jgi:hypothetical protein